MSKCFAEVVGTKTIQWEAFVGTFSFLLLLLLLLLLSVCLCLSLSVSLSVSVSVSLPPSLPLCLFACLLFSGSDIGVVVTMPLTGYFCTLTDIDGGWPLAFYVFGKDCSSGLKVHWMALWGIRLLLGVSVSSKVSPLSVIWKTDQLYTFETPWK